MGFESPLRQLIEKCPQVSSSCVALLACTCIHHVTFRKCVYHTYNYVYMQVDSKGQNFLHLAILKQDVEAVIFLMSVKVDVNSKVKNPTLNTALHYAVKGGSEILVRHLVSEGPGKKGRRVCVYMYMYK